MGLDISALEKAILESRWNESISGPSWLLDLAKNAVNGAFRDVLTSAHARELLAVRQTTADAPLEDWFTIVPSPSQTSEEQESLRLIVAVALLHSFLQANWTGPDLDLRPTEILTVPSENANEITDEILNSRSIAELAYGGEPAYHLAEVPVFLWLAKHLLGFAFHHCPSAAWWKARAWTVHEHILDETVAPPQGVVPQPQIFESAPDLTGRALLEEGLLNHILSQDRAAADLFVRAAKATQLEFELTGALGKRTKFQQTDITQLVLLAESRKREGTPADPQSSETALSSDPGSTLPETLALNDDTLLEQTKFTSSSAAAPGSRFGHIDPSSQPALDPLDQCILLAMCLNVKNTSPAHGLTAEQMAPYVNRVISHAQNWSVHTMALLLRSRLEAHRTRTVERSTLQLQALVDQMPTADSTVAERLAYIHELLLPSKWALQRELAQRYLSLGVARSALEIFERLEMWEDVARCWQSLERPEKGIAVVKDLLEGRKAEVDLVIARGKATSDTRKQTLDAARQAKLWALLGDFEPEHAFEHYTKAWEVSKGTSGRAMRSLGGYYFARGDYPKAIESLRKAVSINPLLTRSWFILGCACVREQQWEGARDAFARCVAIDDEDSESWSNLASVYLRMGEAGQKIEADEENGDDDALKTKQSSDEEPVGRIPFSNKVLAFRALKQGIKFSYDNWRMWSNYMIVAMDVGELHEACRALGRVVEERYAKDGADSVDEDVLERLVDAATRAEAENTAEPGQAETAGPLRAGLLRQVSDLFERVILPRVSSARIFRARARLLTSQGRWEEALGAYMNAYRSSTAGMMEQGETDVEKWREAVREVEEMVDVLRNFGPRAEGYKWRLQARSILRTFMARTKDFEDEPEWSGLVTLQEELRHEE